jgi:mRNA interferase MazF
LALAGPITRRTKGYPFEVRVHGIATLSEVILVDQLRSIDWRARDAAWIGRASAEVMAEVMAKLRPLVGF